MIDPSWVTLLGQVAFPIVMVVWFALRLETRLDANTKKMDELAAAINRQSYTILSVMMIGNDETKEEALRQLRSELRIRTGNS